MKQKKRLRAALLVLLTALTLLTGAWEIPQAQAETPALFLQGSGSDTQITDLAGGSALDGFWATLPENMRGAYNVGNCAALKGRVFVVVLFMDDSESQWSEERMEESYQNVVLPALNYLEDRASRWGVWLNFEVERYTTDLSAGREIRYNGRIGRNLEDNDRSGAILDQAAASLGFTREEYMHAYFQEHSGLEQVVYLVMLDKGGRSYAHRYWYSRVPENDPYLLEYCVVFSGWEDGAYDCGSYAVAHETLHLFGAEDYYPPGSRRELAKKYYPDDLMFCGHTDLKDYVVGDFTAYCVGWTDRAPEICYNLDWWR